MQLYKVRSGAIVLHHQDYFLLRDNWDQIINRDDLYHYLAGVIGAMTPDETLAELITTELLPPIGSQEVWAAGVTWLRSRDARMVESKKSGAATFYDLVYDAPRPELFFKANASRVAGHGQTVNIRKDSSWNVPEPELTLLINLHGKIQGYTIGNDMSSRSIEGENPLYLPQAKTYQWSAALGPCLLILEKPIAPETTISMEIRRGERNVYSDSVAISKMKRSHAELVEYLFRESDFPEGCFLMTGTCLVPQDDFTLNVGDHVRIRIDGIGLLANTVATKA